MNIFFLILILSVSCSQYDSFGFLGDYSMCFLNMEGIKSNYSGWTIRIMNEKTEIPLFYSKECHLNDRIGEILFLWNNTGYDVKYSLNKCSLNKVSFYLGRSALPKHNGNITTNPEFYPYTFDVTGEEFKFSIPRKTKYKTLYIIIYALILC